MRQWQLVIYHTGSAEGIYAFIYCTKWRFGQVSRVPDSLTDRLTTLEDRATQLLIKYKSGALVTQYLSHPPCLQKKKVIVIQFPYCPPCQCQSSSASSHSTHCPSSPPPRCRWQSPWPRKSSFDTKWPFSEIWIQKMLMSESLTSVSRLRPLLSVVVSEVEISESFLFRSLNETVFFLPRRLCHVKKTFQVNFVFSIFWSWREKPQMGQNVARHFSQRLRSLWFDLLWK